MSDAHIVPPIRKIDIFAAFFCHADIRRIISGVETTVHVITIDGPAAAGKSTVAQLLADKLGFRLLNSGLVYRAAAAEVLAAGEDPRDPAAALKGALSISAKHELAAAHPGSAELAGEGLAQAASALASHPQARACLLETQRRFLRPPGLVAEGRDMGSVVFPGALLKIFLTAGELERARRRVRESRNATITRCLGAIRTRDFRDRKRKTSPLTRSENDILIDTADSSPEFTTRKIIALFRERARA